jgi:uncharacterized protein (TIGR03437 family)
MKRLQILLLTLSSCLIAQTQTATYNYSGSPLTIPVSTTNLAAIAEIFVPGALTITSVTTQVQIDYPAVGDLIVYLFSANGTRTVLLSNNCGTLANVNTTFDDAAPTRFSDFCPTEPGRGPFRGNEPLANSKGELSTGYWRLFVQNTASSQRSGTLRSFSVTITGTPITQPSFTADSVANSASLDSGVVAPGELVSIFGIALGPQTGVASNATSAPTSLGGTMVTFDGRPAPILYSSALQVNVQAPYSLTPGTTTQIQVVASGGTSRSVPMDVLSSVTGLFTTGTNGRGQVLAINQDGTTNSVSNGAAAGSFVSLFGAGLGAVTPPVNAGVAAPGTPLSTVNGGVSVVVGGLTAPVLFAGLAPGYIGLYQINIQVPPTLQPGAQRIFVVSPSGFSSQPRVFLQVK